MSQLKNKANAAYLIDGLGLTLPSNEVIFNKVINTLTFVKSQIPTSGVAGTVVTFTLTLTNTSILLPILNVVVTDDLTAAGYTYVAGTAKVDGVAALTTPSDGISVGTIAANATKVVTFNATVN